MKGKKVVQNSQKSRYKYWATRSSVRFFARTAHSFACSILLALLARFARALRCALLRSLNRSLAHFAHSLASGTVIDWTAIFSVFFFLFWTIVRRWKTRNWSNSHPISARKKFRSDLLASPFFFGFTRILSRLDRKEKSTSFKHMQEVKRKISSRVKVKFLSFVAS